MFKSLVSITWSFTCDFSIYHSNRQKLTLGNNCYPCCGGKSLLVCMCVCLNIKTLARKNYLKFYFTLVHKKRSQPVRLLAKAFLVLWCCFLVALRMCCLLRYLILLRLEVFSEQSFHHPSWILACESLALLRTVGYKRKVSCICLCNYQYLIYLWDWLMNLRHVSKWGLPFWYGLKWKCFSFLIA